MIVGLGNPGSKYAGHRHNIGFMAVDQLHRYNGFGAWSEKGKAQVVKGTIDGQPCLLVKPQTYMNASGAAVQRLAHFFKIPPAKIIVIHDELDLPVCKVKIKVGGGTGGHNGLKSLQQQLGTADFKRIRIGIDHPGDKNRVSGYVLSDFSAAEAPKFDALCAALASHFPQILQDEEAQVMSALAQEN